MIRSKNSCLLTGCASVIVEVTAAAGNLPALIQTKSDYSKLSDKNDLLWTGINFEPRINKILRGKAWANSSAYCYIHYVALWTRESGLRTHRSEVESRTQGSRPRTRKNFEAKDRPLEAKDQGHRRKCSPPKKRSSKFFFRRKSSSKIFFQVISTWGN